LDCAFEDSSPAYGGDSYIGVSVTLFKGALAGSRMRQIGKPTHLSPATHYRIQNEPAHTVQRGEDHKAGGE
jgi:hypothetical protein